MMRSIPEAHETQKGNKKTRNSSNLKKINQPAQKVQ